MWGARQRSPSTSQKPTYSKHVLTPNLHTLYLLHACAMPVCHARIPVERLDSCSPRNSPCKPHARTVSTPSPNAVKYKGALCLLPKDVLPPCLRHARIIPEYPSFRIDSCLTRTSPCEPHASCSYRISSRTEIRPGRVGGRYASFPKDVQLPAYSNPPPNLPGCTKIPPAVNDPPPR